jgi:molybdopterin-guanine dinucleotide biosynthesis protein A
MNAGVAVIGGGEATRLPGKLALDAAGVPLIVRTFRNVAPGRETFISCKATFAPEIDALLEAPLVIDRWPLRGPLAGLISTLAQMRSRYVFAVAADAPFVDAAFIERLEREWREGDEAVVPAHGESSDLVLEPLAALYDRFAFLRAGFAEMLEGRASIVATVERLRWRTLWFEHPALLRSINTAADYALLQRRLLT